MPSTPWFFTVKPQTIPIPHLNFKVRVRHIHPSEVAAGSAAFCRFDHRHQATIYLPKRCAPPMAAHEIIHALEHICKSRNMAMEHEREHMAYLMQHLLGQIMGMVWVGGTRPS